MLSTLDVMALVGAGALAGLVGTAGGITSMVSYPALLAIGVPPVAASVTNSVAVAACWPGSAAGSRPELAGQGAWLVRWLPVAALGGGLGAALLLVTPSGAFERIVPFLVAVGALALLLEPRLRRRRPSRRPSAALAFGVTLLSLYNGYFGAGAGIMTLTLMLLVVDDRLPTANALKNMLVGAASIACAVVYAFGTHVRWSAVAPLALGMLVGSALGPRVTRRVPARVLRPVIAVLGLALAVQLAIDPTL